LHHLGLTRSSLKHDHLLHTPNTFIRTPLPGAAGVEFVVHVAPHLGARFCQMTAELALTAGGREYSLKPEGFAFLPQGVTHTVRAVTASRAALIEKPYERLAGSEAVAAIVVGTESDVAPVALMGDEALRVRSLMPDGPAYDFAVNTMTYDPGAALSMVEVHVMEHGLLMLEGGGIYRLGDSWYPVQAGDFIWMGAYCPQWFGALGKRPAKYLIYKDWRRHPLGE
jgi:(S)-ureidoglycine aminohydrolase